MKRLMDYNIVNEVYPLILVFSHYSPSLNLWDKYNFNKMVNYYDLKNYTIDSIETSGLHSQCLNIKYSICSSLVF